MVLADSYIVVGLAMFITGISPSVLFVSIMLHTAPGDLVTHSFRCKLLLMASFPAWRVIFWPQSHLASPTGSNCSMAAMPSFKSLSLAFQVSLNHEQLSQEVASNNLPLIYRNQPACIVCLFCCFICIVEQ